MFLSLQGVYIEMLDNNDVSLLSSDNEPNLFLSPVQHSMQKPSKFTFQTIRQWIISFESVNEMT